MIGLKTVVAPRIFNEILERRYKTIKSMSMKIKRKTIYLDFTKTPGALHD